MQLHEILEAVMMICFGCSWPLQIIKTIQVKNPVGKSFGFLFLLLFGYISGIVGKLIYAPESWLIYFYLLNTTMVCSDITLSLYYLYKIKHKTGDTPSYSTQTVN